MTHDHLTALPFRRDNRKHSVGYDCAVAKIWPSAVMRLYSRWARMSFLVSLHLQWVGSLITSRCRRNAPLMHLVMFTIGL